MASGLQTGRYGRAVALVQMKGEDSPTQAWRGITVTGSGRVGADQTFLRSIGIEVRAPSGCALIYLKRPNCEWSTTLYPRKFGAGA